MIQLKGKFYAQKIELVTRHWSGKHRRVVQGINLITLLWTQGDSYIPKASFQRNYFPEKCRYDYRLYERSSDGATKMTTSAQCFRVQNFALSNLYV